MSGDAAPLLALAQRIVDRAAPGEAIEAYVVRSSRTATRARKGELESIEQATTAGAGIRVVVEGRLGFAYAGSLDDDAVADALAAARDNAEHSSPDDANALALPDGVAQPDLPAPDGELVSLPAEAKVELALALERAALAADARVTGVTSADWADAVGASAVATTTGLRSTQDWAGWSASASVLAGEGADVQESYAVDAGRRWVDVDVDAVGREAAERTVALLGARQPASRRVTVVLDPYATAQLLGVIGQTLLGDAALKGRSCFADRVGEKVAAPAVTLVDDATDPASNGAGRHDGEGLASRRTVLVADGVLNGFLHSTWSARRSGAPPTASAVRDFSTTPHVGTRAFAIAPGHLEREDVLRQVGDGIYVQNLGGLHSGTNPVSGDFSVSVLGNVIRNGALAEPVREATIASSLQRMLLDVVAVGADRRWMAGGTGSLTLAIEGVSLSGS